MESSTEMGAASAVQDASLGKEIVRRIQELGAISEETDKLTRIYLSKELRTAADLILGWMREAGMSAHLDAIGNVSGRYEGERRQYTLALSMVEHGARLRTITQWTGLSKFQIYNLSQTYASATRTHCKRCRVSGCRITASTRL